MKNLLWLTLILLLTACDDQSEKMQVISGETMGTTYQIKYYSQDHTDLKPAVDSVLQLVNASLSTYIPQSTISRFNQASSYGLVDAYFLTNFKKALEVGEQSAGAFDMTVMPLVNAWGFGFKKMAGEVDSVLIDSLLQLVGPDKIRLSGDTLFKDLAGVMVDFSALAKGFGVDEVGRYLSSRGINAFMVEIGGEVLTKGSKPVEGDWQVGIEKPIDDPSGAQKQLEFILPLKDKAMATSGNYRNFYIRDGKKFAHEIDPKTGYPVNHNLLSATVITADCMTADAWATAFMVMGLEKSKAIAERNPAMEVAFIYADEQGQNQLYLSPGLAAQIQSK